MKQRNNLRLKGQVTMRVCYLINQYPKVSHSFIRREIRELERQGIEVERVSVRGWNLELTDEADAQERKSTTYLLRAGFLALLTAFVRGIVTTPKRFGRAVRMMLDFASRSTRSPFVFAAYLLEAMLLADIIRRKNIAHIHAHFGTNSTDVAILAGELAGVGYSFTVHGPDEFDSPVALSIGEKISRARFVVAISAFGRGQLLRWCDYEHWPKIHVVHCGVDAAFFEQPDRESEPRRLVCVGRLCREKGQVLLVQAASILQQQGQDFLIVLAGDGEMRPEIEALIAREGLQDKVRLLGWVDGATVRRELLAARALVLPSLMEGLPVVIMEALALRRPVITTYVAGIPELVRTGQEGWLIPAGSVDDLAAALKDCIEAPGDQIARMGASGRARAQSRHSSRSEAAKLAALFQNSAPAGSSSGAQ